MLVPAEKPIWHDERPQASVSVHDVERIREAMRAALAPLSSLDLRWLLVDGGRRMRELAEEASRARDEADALVAELEGAEREAAAATAKLEEARRVLKAAAKTKDTRLQPYADALELVHRAESDARESAAAVEAVREALARRRDPAPVGA